MDCRDFANLSNKWYERITDDEKYVIINLYWEDEEDSYEEEVKVPIKYEVCNTCNGKGTHVNPSIDAHGISSEEFNDDPGFAEDYFSGVYNVSCYECKGKRVVPEINEEFCNDELLDRVREHQKVIYEMNYERAREIKYGY